MKLALDVWYEAWSRTEGKDTGAADHGEVVSAVEAVRDGARPVGGVRRAMDGLGDVGQSP